MMATIMNHPHPIASPAITSVNQCTPSKARLVATEMAINAAPPASRARTILGLSRPSTSAIAAQQDAAATVCPDGNE